MVLHEVIALNIGVNNQLASCPVALGSLLPKFHLSSLCSRKGKYSYQRRSCGKVC